MRGLDPGRSRRGSKDLDLRSGAFLFVLFEVLAGDSFTKSCMASKMDLDEVKQEAKKLDQQFL